MAKEQKQERVAGFSLFELLIVLAIMFVLASFAIPAALSVTYDSRLRGTAANLAGLIQQARIIAAQQNAVCPVRYTTVGNQSVAYVDVNASGSYSPSEPMIPFTGTVVAATGAPSGASGQPSAYVFSGDTGTGSYDNATTLAFSPRGLPCQYDTTTNPPTCTTPAAKYFVYYLYDTRIGGGHSWAAVAVLKSGRVRILHWNGSAWL